MNLQNSKRNQYKMPAFLMAVLVSNRLTNVLADNSVVWWWHDATQALALALAITWVAILVPYSSIKSKCLASAMAAAAWVEVAFVAAFILIGFKGYLIALCIQSAAFFVILLFIWMRSYDEPSDILDSDHIFLFRRKPDSPQGILMAFLGLPGGYSIYMDGMLYGYRKGVFCAYEPHSIDLSKFHIEKGTFINHAPEVVVSINDMIGQEWKPWRNCMQLRKIWKGAH